MECTDGVQVTGAGANSELSYIIEYKFNLVFIFYPIVFRPFFVFWL